MWTNSPPLEAKESITEPKYSSGTSIWTSSNGSHLTPSISLTITWGLETCNSKPSRLIFSIKIDKCNSPRPETIKFSVFTILSTFKETSLCTSLNNLSSIFEQVNNLPSCPANGEVLTPNVICNVGGSILNNGNGSTLFNSHTVSPTEISLIPAIATMSPAWASLISILFKPK